MQNNKKAIIIILIFFLSFILNSIGIKWGLPSKERANLIVSREKISFAIAQLKKIQEKEWQNSHRLANTTADERLLLNIIRPYQPDEQYILKSLASMNPAKLNFDPHFYIYPAFITYLLGFCIKILSIFKVVLLKNDLIFYYLEPDEFGKLYLVGRFMCAAFGAGVSILIYLISKKIFSEKNIISLFATLLTILLPLNIYWARFILGDVPATFFMILTLYFALYLQETGKTKFYILCGIAAGLAISSKYTVLIVLVPVYIAHFLYSKKIINKNIVLTGLIAILIFVILNPYLILSYKNAVKDLISIKLVKNQGWGYNSVDISPMFFYIFNTLIYNGLGLLYTLAGVVSLFSLFFIKKNELIIYLCFLLFYIVLSTSKYVAYHYLYLFIPLMNIFIAKIFVEKFKKIGIIIILFILLDFVVYDYIYLKAYLKCDTRMETGKWINNNIKENSTLAYIDNQTVAFNCPPFDFYKFKLFQINSFQDLQMKKPQYIILTNYAYRNYYRLKNKLQVDDFKIYDYLLNTNDYEKVFKASYNLKFGPFTIKQNLDVSDDMIHINPEFIVLKLKERI